jgi:hypothetical protein
MFALTKAGGQCLAMPDVCKTPTPAGPVPIPYPNIAMPAQANPVVNKVSICGAAALNLNSKISMSNGDQAGVAGGVVSNKIMGEAQFTMGSLTVSIGGAPAVKLTSPTTQNGAPPNAVGVTLAPSQAKVMILT